MHSIQHLLHIQHPIEQVFRAISTPDGLCSWYSRTDDFTASEGATFKIYFGEMGFQFEVVELIENKRIAWKCVEAAMPIEGHIMAYSLDENDGKTRVRFKHEGFEAADDAMANMNFSSAKYLESLRQYCQTGNGEAFGSERYRIWELHRKYRYTLKMKLFLTNQNKAERITRFIISLFLLPSFFIPGPSWYSTLVGSVGAILLFNALVGTCFIYRLFGANTCKVDWKKNGAPQWYAVCP